ncbi:hypothetical protein Leryth_027666 [Lithospermum erythrorhizon]|nr:hypothetical protein Leryth_027666 [Lithospermum erythrorhizon]
MAVDSTTPLLTRSTDPEREQHKPQYSSIEEITEPYLRNLTWPQILQAMLGFLPLIFEAQTTFVSIFADKKPTWHCTNLEQNSSCSSSSDICKLPSSSWSWDKPAYTSTVSEWALECASNRVMEGLPASSFFIGCLVTGFALFFIGDSFGRKKMLFCSSIIMSVATFCTAFSMNVWVYSAMRFTSGIGRAAIGSCALVIATESVGKKWQGKVGSVGFVVFTMGSLSLPPIAYFLQNYSWRIMYVLISIPSISYCIILQLFAYESPKWLLSQGRQREALQVLNKLAGNDDETTEILESYSKSWKIIDNEDQENKEKSSFLRSMLERKVFSKQLLFLVTMSFGIGLVYYGVAFSVGNLDFDLYWGATFNYSLQIVTFLIIFSTVTKLKRRTTLLLLTTISGISCIVLCTNLGKQLFEVGMELLAFFGASTAFSLLLIYTAELFPTCARNSAVAIVWQALILGGVVSPVLIAAAGENSLISYGVFGISVIATGFIVILLPETIGVKSSVDDCMEDTVGKQENGV